MDEACASDDPPRRTRITVAHTRAGRRWIARNGAVSAAPLSLRNYGTRAARRISRPLPKRIAASSAAIQSGKPVNGRLAVRTGVEIAPRTPAACGLVELTPLTPPPAATTRCFGRAVTFLVAGCTVAVVVVVVEAPHCAASSFSPGEAGSFSRMSLRPSSAGCFVWPFSHALMLTLMTTYGFVAEPVRWQMITLW